LKTWHPIEIIGQQYYYTYHRVDRVIELSNQKQFTIMAVKYRYRTAFTHNKDAFQDKTGQWHYQTKHPRTTTSYRVSQKKGYPVSVKSHQLNGKSILLNGSKTLIIKGVMVVFLETGVTFFWDTRYKNNQTQQKTKHMEWSTRLRIVWSLGLHTYMRWYTSKGGKCENIKRTSQCNLAVTRPGISGVE